MNKKLTELKISNNMLYEKINSENQIIFTDMICYIRGSNISDYNQELVRHDLSEMIISAQERGENIHSLIGKDFKLFCDEVIENIPKRTFNEHCFLLIDMFSYSCILFLVINVFLSKDLFRIIKEFLSEETVNYNISFTISTSIISLLIIFFSFGIVNVICKNSLKSSNKLNSSSRVIIGGVLGGIIGLLLSLIIRTGNNIIFSINLIYIIFSILLILIIKKIWKSKLIFDIYHS
ncbi:MAG: hypothetical protein ACRDA4_09340 [Filifactoraceae bacterium]